MPTPVPPDSSLWFPRTRRFWHRLTDGMALDELWTQLRTGASSSYSLYAREAAAAPLRSRPGRRPRRHGSGWDFCWAIILKMPASRRLVFLAAMAIFIVWPAWSPLAVLLILALLALEIADRVAMKRDLEIAREIQLWLLPASPPAVTGADLAFLNRPANTVSGDFYDAFWRAGAAPNCAPTRLLFTVADVAGKGVPAAMLMATLQASLRTLAAGPGGLEQIVAGLNHYACAHSAQGSHFTTAFVAEYDPVGRQLRYYNAGHNPPVLRRAAGTIERLETGGVPLGIRLEPAYACAALRLEPADLLLVFSDGLTDSFNAQGHDYGEARLLAALSAAPAPSAAALLDRLVNDSATFRAGTPQQDDITCLALQLAPVVLSASDSAWQADEIPQASL